MGRVRQEREHMGDFVEDLAGVASFRRVRALQTAAEEGGLRATEGPVRDNALMLLVCVEQGPAE